MKDVLRDYWQLRNKARNNCDDVSSILSVQPHEIPAGFFNMAFNDITLALELLDHYNKIWGEQTKTTCSSVEEARNQNAQRVIAIQKMVFIEIMSSFEFSAKQYIGSESQIIGTFQGRVYLRGIMKRSKDSGIISASDLTLWEGVVNCRNNLVHNNGISEINAVYTYPKCTLRMEKDKMTQGDLRLFPRLSDWLLDSGLSWILKLNLA